MADAVKLGRYEKVRILSVNTGMGPMQEHGEIDLNQQLPKGEDPDRWEILSIAHTGNGFSILVGKLHDDVNRGKVS